MLQTQLEEIKVNIKKKLDQYESGIEKYPYFYYKEGQSPLYDYDTSKLKTVDQSKVNSFIDNFWNSYKYVEIFYKSHEETPATEKECREGIDYLNQEKVLQTVIEYFVGEGITSLEILETVKDMTCNRDVLHDVGRALLKEERGRVWLNEAHFSAFMQEASVYNAEFELSRDKVQEMAVNLHHNDFEARRYFHDEIDDEYQLHMLYSLIHASPQFRDYIDYDVVYEDIPEDYYTSISNLEELRKENSNLLPLTKGKAFDDKGYWVSFNHRYYSDRKTIYIIIPNAVEEKIIIKSFDMMLR